MYKLILFTPCKVENENIHLIDITWTRFLFSSQCMVHTVITELTRGYLITLHFKEGKDYTQNVTCRGGS